MVPCYTATGLAGLCLCPAAPVAATPTPAPPASGLCCPVGLSLLLPQPAACTFVHAALRHAVCGAACLLPFHLRLSLQEKEAWPGPGANTAFVRHPPRRLAAPRTGAQLRASWPGVGTASPVAGTPHGLQPLLLLETCGHGIHGAYVSLRGRARGPTFASVPLGLGVLGSERSGCTQSTGAARRSCTYAAALREASSSRRQQAAGALRVRTDA